MPRFLLIWIACTLGFLIIPNASPGDPGRLHNGDAIQTEVYLVSRDSRNRPVVLLRDPGGKRLLPIWIGECEAQAIARKLYKEDFPRPLTHDLLKSVLEATGARLQSVLVDELRPLGQGSGGGTYFAILTLMKPDSTSVQVDSRPSDAMALAVRMGVPIYVSRKILEDNSIPDEGGSAPPNLPREPDRAPNTYY